jgi:omega-6 fatty acid desaturase (delta-12 desaturase)
MSARQQRQYRSARNIWLAPFAGFMYLLFNPRYTWLKGSVSLLRHLIGKKIAQPGISIKAHALEFKTPYWSSAQEYWHIFWSNVVLLSLWGVMAWWIGSALFFVCYTVSVSLSGAASILLFAVQHNFDHSYASEDEGWDYDTAAIEGTSFLDLPRWLNWLTMNIAYHHVHHLSARIPNYCLVQCHNENEQLFTNVARIKLSQVPRALKCILWDMRARCIISVAEYRRQTSAP